jgi:hypothetical protein
MHGPSKGLCGQGCLRRHTNATQHTAPGRSNIGPFETLIETLNLTYPAPKLKTLAAVSVCHISLSNFSAGVL